MQKLSEIPPQTKDQYLHRELVTFDLGQTSVDANVFSARLKWVWLAGRQWREWESHHIGSVAQRNKGQYLVFIFGKLWARHGQTLP